MTSAAPAYHRFSAASKWHAGAALDMPYICDRTRTLRRLLERKLSIDRCVVTAAAVESVDVPSALAANGESGAALRDRRSVGASGIRHRVRWKR